MTAELWPDGYDTGPITTTGSLPVVLSTAEAAAKLGIPAGTIHAWASRRQLRPVHYDRRGWPIYREDDLVALRDRTRTLEEWHAIWRRRERAQRDATRRRGTMNG